MAGRARSGTDMEARDVALYVAAMTRELKDLVVPYEMRALAYLLDLAHREAEEQAREGQERRAVRNAGSA